MQLIRAGATRCVFIVGDYVIKVPIFEAGWRAFIVGMSANLNERLFSKCSDFDGLLCPVVFSDPIGLVVVMPRCNICGSEEYAEIQGHIRDRFGDLVGSLIEDKWNSFGWLGDRIVAVDYG